MKERVFQPKTVSIKRSGNLVEYKAEQIKFRGLEKQDKNVNEVIPKLFNRLIERAIEESGVPLKDVRFAAELYHGDSKYDHPLGMQFRQYPRVDGQVIYNLMGKIQQSNDELTLDGITVTIYIHNTGSKHVPYLQGSGKNSALFDTALGKHID